MIAEIAHALPLVAFWIIVAFYAGVILVAALDTLYNSLKRVLKRERKDP